MQSRENVSSSFCAQDSPGTVVATNVPNYKGGTNKCRCQPATPFRSSIFEIPSVVIGREVDSWKEQRVGYNRGPTIKPTPAPRHSKCESRAARFGTNARYSLLLLSQNLSASR